MYPINDRQYLAICAQIAKLQSVSLSSAKKKVEIQIAKKGSKTIEEKKQKNCSTTSKEIYWRL